jgi:hypothetical protein
MIQNNFQNTVLVYYSLGLVYFWKIIPHRFAHIVCFDRILEPSFGKVGI